LVIRGPAAGFLARVCFEECDRVSPGSLVAQLEIPDLASRIAEKKAEVAQAEAKLKLLRAGTRPEELEDQRGRVKRAEHWRDLARHCLGLTKNELRERLARLDQAFIECQAIHKFSKSVLDLYKNIVASNAITAEQYEEAQKNLAVSAARMLETQAERRALDATGTMKAEEELENRERQLADKMAKLVLLEAGTRPEEIDAAQSHVNQIREEANYLERLRDRLLLRTNTPGVVVTPRMNEKIGHYYEEGDLICEVEEPLPLRAEVTLTEDEVAQVKPGQTIELKARALPFGVIHGKVEQIAPRTTEGELQNKVVVYCTVDDHDEALRPGMSGYARIYSDRCCVGWFLVKKIVRMLRTEFWW
jgi:multidrug resistance efflux pump